MLIQNCIHPFWCDFPFGRYLAPKLHKFCEKSEKCIQIILSKDFYGLFTYQIKALDVLNLNMYLTCTRDLYIRNFWRQKFQTFCKNSVKCIQIGLSKGFYGQLRYQIKALNVLNLNICLTCTRDLYIRNFWRQNF